MRPFCIALVLFGCSDPQRSSEVTFVEPVEGSESEAEGAAEPEAEAEAESEQPEERGEMIEIGEPSGDVESEGEVDEEGASESTMIERIERIEQDDSTMIQRVEVEASSTEDPGAVVRRCRYEHACIVENLRHRTDSPMALGIVAEAYSAMGDEAARRRTIETLKRLHPDSTVARMYR